MTQPIVLITGGSGGVAASTAQLFAEAGYRLALVSRQADKAQALADQHQALLIEADVSTLEGAKHALSRCQAELGVPTTLVHAAGNTLIKAAHSTSAEQYRAVMAANLDSAFFTATAWIELMRAEKVPGSAVFFSSVVARIGVANHEAIAAAKGGVEALVRSLAATYAASQLRFNAIAPGMTETPMTANMLKSDAVREAAGKQYPVGGVGQPDELASLALWLASHAARRVTGQVIAVDGGFTSIRPLVR